MLQRRIHRVRQIDSRVNQRAIQIEHHQPRNHPSILTAMNRQAALVLYGVAMVAIIVAVDIVFFKNRFWERLTANIGIVLVFAAFYFRFLRRP